MFDLSAIARRFANLVTETPTTYTYNSTDYTGIKTNKQADTLFLDAGKIDSYQFTLLIKVGDFGLGFTPANNELVTIDEIEHRILDQDIDSFGITLNLHLGSKYQSEG